MCLGIPGVVQEITDREAFLAMVDVSGVRRKVNVACVAGPEELDGLVGQWVLVHVGFAMGIVDEDEAQKTLELLSNKTGRTRQVEQDKSNKIRADNEIR